MPHQELLQGWAVCHGHAHSRGAAQRPTRQPHGAHSRATRACSTAATTVATAVVWLRLLPLPFRQPLPAAWRLVDLCRGPLPVLRDADAGSTGRVQRGAVALPLAGGRAVAAAAAIAASCTLKAQSPGRCLLLLLPVCPWLPVCVFSHHECAVQQLYEAMQRAVQQWAAHHRRQV